MGSDVKLTALESCQAFSTDRPEKREEAIECYSRWIDNAERLIKENDSVMEKDNIYKQLAIGYNERGFIKYQQVDFDEAIADYTKALCYDSQLHYTYYNRGLIHYRLGRFEKAIEDMTQALRLEKNFEPAVRCLDQAQKDKQCKHNTETQSVES